MTLPAMPPRDQALTLATRDLVRGSGGGEAASGFCRVGQQKLSAYGSIDRPEAWMPVDVVADLEAVTVGHPHHPIVTRHLALRAGYGLVPLAGAACPPAKSWHVHLADLAKEFSEAIAAIGATAVDGRIDPRDVRGRREAVGQIDDLIRVAVCARAALVEGD